MVDDVDLVEKINPENPRQYCVQRPLQNMRVRKRPSVLKPGPGQSRDLIDPPWPDCYGWKGSNGKAISARWAFTEGLHQVKPQYLLAKAKNIQGLKEGLKYGTAFQNIVFADVDGNIRGIGVVRPFP